MHIIVYFYIYTLYSMNFAILWLENLQKVIINAMDII